MRGVLLLAFVLTVGGGFASAQDDFELVAPDEFALAPDDETGENGSKAPILTTETVETADENASAAVETLPAEAVVPAIPLDGDGTDGENPETAVVDDAEMARLRNDPFFREFSAAFDAEVPFPTIPGLDGEIVVENGAESGVRSAEIGEPSGTNPLDEVLAIADVDLDALEISPQERATLERFDAEIARLCPLWRDAELNKNVVGRREPIWERDAGGRFETNEPKPVATASDWALALDAPFFFQVVDAATGDVFYTKAGDFELVDGAPALIRDVWTGEEIFEVGESEEDGGSPVVEERTFVLTVEPGPGVPSGRAERARVLTDGKIQGVDASGKRVVDVNLGKIALYMFDNPGRLESADGVFFVPSERSGKPRLAKLPPNSPVGVQSGRLTLSNGRPDEILARIVVLCKSKKRLVEILTQPRLSGAK